MPEVQRMPPENQREQKAKPSAEESMAGAGGEGGKGGESGQWVTYFDGFSTD